MQSIVPAALLATYAATVFTVVLIFANRRAQTFHARGLCALCEGSGATVDQGGRDMSCPSCIGSGIWQASA